MSYVEEEIASQPEIWSRAAELAATPAVAAMLPEKGSRVAIVGCGTSLYMAQAFAALRESAGQGETDAFAASEFPSDRPYDLVVALTRSGTTTEVIRVLASLPGGRRSTVITTATDLPAAQEADHCVLLDFADEKSVVQTRFATAALALWRAFVGHDLGESIEHARLELMTELPERLLAARQYTFLGTGWTVGLASEAGLKLREASQSWAEAYPAMEFRHGPISVVDERSAVWIFGQPPVNLLADLAPTGALILTSDRDPMAHLIGAQLLAVARAKRAGLDPDAPRNLTRSIVLAAG